MERKYIAPCGLLCLDCLFYRKDIYETAAKLQEVIKESQLDTFLNLIVRNQGWKNIAAHLGEDSEEMKKQFEPFADLPHFLEVLDALIKLECKTPCTEAGGCSVGGKTGSCQALKCIQTRQIEGCWECTEFETCEKLVFLRRSYGDTIKENLTAMRDKGPDFIKSHGNRYYAWQKK